MTDEDPTRPNPGPNLTDRGQRDALERRRRQAQALRANLGRRKAQDRARDDAEVAGENSRDSLENKD